MLSYQMVTFAHSWALKNWSLGERYALSEYVSEGIKLLVEPFLTVKGQRVLEAMRKRTHSFGALEARRPATRKAPAKKSEVKTPQKDKPEQTMIDLSIEGAIAKATLNRPPVNAINEEWVARLDEVLNEVERHEAVGVLWIRSSEKVFCAGADLALMRSIFDSPEGRERMIDLTRRMQEVFARLEALPKATLAEIGGAAMGGGFELALACDLRIVSDSARVGLPEARLGLLPAAGGTQRMTRLCGESVARRLILGAELVTGKEAAGLGLAQWSAPPENILSAAAALAARVAELPPTTLAANKHCINIAAMGAIGGYEAELEGSAMLLAEKETQRRVTVFLERR